MNTRTYAPRQTATQAYIARLTEIRAQLERLTEAAKDEFGMHGKELHWGHVGDLEAYAENLRRITDAVFKEGEHAPE